MVNIIADFSKPNLGSGRDNLLIHVTLWKTIYVASVANWHICTPEVNNLVYFEASWYKYFYWRIWKHLTYFLYILQYYTFYDIQNILNYLQVRFATNSFKKQTRKLGLEPLFTGLRHWGHRSVDTFAWYSPVTTMILFLLSYEQRPSSDPYKSTQPTNTL